MNDVLQEVAREIRGELREMRTAFDDLTREQMRANAISEAQNATADKALGLLVNIGSNRLVQLIGVIVALRVFGIDVDFFLGLVGMAPEAAP